VRKLSVGIIDLVAKSPDKAYWGRVMNPNFASIMPQVIGAWCEQAGHEVSLVCYTGREDILEELPQKTDIVFISAFTQAAHFAYALSNIFRSRGAVTVLGGPHARCYPDDARKYFDYVLGFTDQELITTIVKDCAAHRPEGLCLSAAQHPKYLPGIAQRWKFIERTLRKAPYIKIVPLIASLGCPYSCQFCIDSSVPYQPLDIEMIRHDLRFILEKIDHPLVAWHDPSYGVRFDECMNLLTETVPPGRINFIAETTLSLLTESKVMRLKANGFKALLPGIESWYDLGYKSKTRTVTGMEKVKQISEHVNMILRHIPYVQTNFIFGLDSDSGQEPFMLTRRFVELAPGAFPAYSLMSAFGQAAPLNLEYQRANRILPFPFHFLNNNGAMNVRPKNYTWPEFYDHIIDVTRHSFSKRMIMRRFAASRGSVPKWLNVIRAISSEGYGRIKYFREIRRRLDSDAQFRKFFDQETAQVPEFFIQRIRHDLGPFWKWLPDGALYHNQNAYLDSIEKQKIPGFTESAKCARQSDLPKLDESHV
jgi:hypothetical protein